VIVINSQAPRSWFSQTHRATPFLLSKKSIVLIQGDPKIALDAPPSMLLSALFLVSLSVLLLVPTVCFSISLRHLIPCRTSSPHGWTWDDDACDVPWEPPCRLSRRGCEALRGPHGPERSGRRVSRTPCLAARTG